jgi:hypothetical protein
MTDQLVSDAEAWKFLVLLSPLIAWGLYMKFRRWRDRRRRLAEGRRQLREDLRKGRL